MRCKICDVKLSKIHQESIDIEVCDECTLSALEDWHEDDVSDISNYVDFHHKQRSWSE